MPNHDQIELEGRLSLAIQAYNEGKIKSLCAASRSYDVPFSSLYTRDRGTSSRRDTRPSTCKLTSTEEEVVLQYIVNLNTQGFPPRICIVEK